ncbi:TetR/AcrR family transcriptional regulator [Gordonia sihwensis]|uniref:TetR/AcrR family transcriptional regulator n=1 Tax=Gordonia sihwensis TaxID=173559 RepID=UPI003D964E38
MPKPTIRASGRYDLILEQLLDAAETLFARQGVAGTSLQELAEAVGLTRTGVYHYVKGKDELLEHLVRGFTLETAERLTELTEEAERPAAERLREAVSSMAKRIAEHPRRFRLLLTSEDSFPELIAKQHRAARRATLDAMVSLIDQAKSEGGVRPIDTRLTAFSLLGVTNWMAFWYRPEQVGDLTPQQVADAMASIALDGVFSERASGADSMHAALALLEEDVSRLRQFVDAAD